MIIIKRLSFWGLILTLIAYGTFKGLAWYHVNRFMLQVKSAAESQLAIRHGWIGSSVSGEITIHDVEVVPFQLRKPLFADEVFIRFGSVIDMLSSFPLFSRDEKYKLPESLEIEWRNVELPLSKGWGAYLPDSALQQKFFGLACGRKVSFGVDEFSEMGYGNISHSVILSYEYESLTDQLELSLDARFEGMGQYLAQLDLQLTHPLQWPPPVDSAPPRLNSFELSFEDQSLLRRVALLCGKQGDYDQQEFIKASLARTKSVFSKAGISISASLLNAYGTFLEGDSVFEIFAEPERSVDLSALPFMSAEEIAQTMNYSVYVNRVLIPEGNFLVDANQLAEYLQPSPQAKPPASKPAPVHRKATFQLLPVANIDQFVGSTIRIEQRSGKKLEGLLTATDKHRLDIDVPQTQSQGKVMVHLDKFDVAELWVLSSKNLSSYRSAEPEVAVSKALVDTKTRENAAPEKEDITRILSTIDANIDANNAEIIYEDGTDIDTPLAEGEYFEIIEIEEAEPVVNPTINDLPAGESAAISGE